MKEFKSPYTDEIMSCIASVNDNLFFTGNRQGAIRLWLVEDIDNISFFCIGIYHEHTETIIKILPIDANHFLSLSKDGTVKIWSIFESGYTLKTIKVAQHSGVLKPADIVLLDNNLLVVKGGHCEISECFDVWDIETGKCLFDTQGLLLRPWGTSFIKINKNFIVWQGYCEYNFTVWYINRDECYKIVQIPDERVYSSTFSPTGEIITAGFNINIFKLDRNNTPYLYKSLVNSNTIDNIISLGDYRLLTFDRRHNSNRIICWDYLFDFNQVLSNGKGQGHLFLPSCQALLSVGDTTFYIKYFSVNVIQDNNDVREIRKNARLLAQSFRTDGIFARLPVELNVKIASLSSDSVIDESIKERIASDYFCKP